MGSVVGYGPYVYKYKSDEVLAGWRRALAELATCPNIYLKPCPTMSHLASFDYGKRKHPRPSEQLTPY
jgi:L-fuconolactonase